MSEEEMTAEDKKAMEALAKNVGEALANGVSQDEIVNDLVGNGMDQADAEGFVATVGEHVPAGDGDEGRGIPGWMIWVGGLVLFNVLSYIFNWGWIVW